jgi:hypothetical protein
MTFYKVENQTVQKAQRYVIFSYTVYIVLISRKLKLENTSSLKLSQNSSDILFNYDTNYSIKKTINNYNLTHYYLLFTLGQTTRFLPLK